MSRADPLALIPDLLPMEAKLGATLPDESGWEFVPKWDGFRSLAFRHGTRLDRCDPTNRRRNARWISLRMSFCRPR